MSEYNEVFTALRQVAKEYGWALFHESDPTDTKGYLLNLVDVQKAYFDFDYDGLVRDESPPALSVHITDGMGSKDKVGG